MNQASHKPVMYSSVIAGIHFDNADSAKDMLAPYIKFSPMYWLTSSLQIAAASPEDFKCRS